MEMMCGEMSTAIRLLRVAIQLSSQNNFPQAFAFSVDGVKHFAVHLTMQITFTYKVMRFAVGGSKNHWRMTILDDPDLVANSNIGSTQPEISATSPKEAAAMVDLTPSAFKDRKAVEKM